MQEDPAHEALVLFERIAQHPNAASSKILVVIAISAIPVPMLLPAPNGDVRESDPGGGNIRIDGPILTIWPYCHIYGFVENNH